MRLTSRPITLKGQSAKTVLLTACLLVCLMLSGSRAPTAFENLMQTGELLVISRNGPTTFYEGAAGPTGFEYALTKAFARSLGLTLKIEQADSFSGLLSSVGRTHALGAAGLSITKNRAKKVIFTRPYMYVTPHVLFNKKSTAISSIEDLKGKKGLVVKGSSHAERLKSLKSQYPFLDWEERDNIESIDLLDSLNKREVDYVVVSSTLFDVNTNVYPNLQNGFELGDPEPIAWAFPKHGDKTLLEAANRFLESYEKSGSLSDLVTRHFGHRTAMLKRDAEDFSRHIEELLPHWQETIKNAADQHQLDWMLLAALSYQESRWDPSAKSSTGVRGFMMLTKNTAKELGVVNRLDPYESIQGGAKYFKTLLDRVSDDIEGDERFWFALAAYNIGFGHLEDARLLTQASGGNPNRWDEVKTHLPLLTKRQYYQKTKHGYARGRETVKYVSNVRHFYNILETKNVDGELASRLFSAST